jgi:hypothetical protein
MLPSWLAAVRFSSTSTKQVRTNMTLTERVRAAQRNPADWDVPGLLSDVEAILTVYDAVIKTLIKAHDGILADLEKLTIPESLVGEVADLRAVFAAIGHLQTCSANAGRNDKALIRYDRMDPEKKTWKFRLEVCPNCNLPGRVEEGKDSVIYVHIAEKRGKKRHRHERSRHFCELSRDGRDVAILSPGRLAEEKHGL